MHISKKDAIGLTIGAAIALAASGVAYAESYKVMDGQPTNVIFIDPANVQKNGSKVDTAVVAILEKPRANGMVAQQINFSIDCDAGSMKMTALIDLDATHKELARKAVSDPASKPGKDSMGENLMSYACTGKFKKEGQTFKSFAEAQTAASNIIANYRIAKARKDAEAGK